MAGSVYLGVPSVAGEIANGTRWLRGPAVYTLAALRAVARWHPAAFSLHGTAGEHDFAGYAVVIANSAYFGAGMQVAPPAVIDDGQLDLVLMRHGPKLTFLRALTRIKDGSHVSLDLISLDRETDLTLTVDRPMPVAADGETIPFAAPLPAATPIRIRVLPAALTVIAPPVGLAAHAWRGRCGRGRAERAGGYEAHDHDQQHGACCREEPAGQRALKVKPVLMAGGLEGGSPGGARDFAVAREPREQPA